MQVLRAFVASANEQYRAAGLHRHQLRMTDLGDIDESTSAGSSPRHHAAAHPNRSRRGNAGSTTGPSQARAGAQAARTGPAPTISGMGRSGNEAVQLTWNPIAGATKYGVYHDGKLIGTVSDTKYAAQLAPSSSAHIQIDAVLATGARSPLTAPVQVARDAAGSLNVRSAQSSA
jgi:hypothetical protein